MFQSYREVISNVYKYHPKWNFAFGYPNSNALIFFL